MPNLLYVRQSNLQYGHCKFLIYFMRLGSLSVFLCATGIPFGVVVLWNGGITCVDLTGGKAVLGFEFVDWLDGGITGWGEDVGTEVGAFSFNGKTPCGFLIV